MGLNVAIIIKGGGPVGGDSWSDDASHTTAGGAHALKVVSVCSRLIGKKSLRAKPVNYMIEVYKYEGRN